MTLVILGLIGTTNALEKTSENIHFLAADVEKTAEEILFAGLSKKKIFFYPRYFSIIASIHCLFPSIVEFFARFSS